MDKYTRSATGGVVCNGKELSTDVIVDKLNGLSFLSSVFLKDPDSGNDLKLIGVNPVDGALVIVTEKMIPIVKPDGAIIRTQHTVITEEIETLPEEAIEEPSEEDSPEEE